MKKKTKGTPDKTDVHVGQRLRVRRELLGMSQEKLAEAIDLTFQQIQKYERGVNRISAGRLYNFAKILGVTVGWFYEGLSFDPPQQDGFNEEFFNKESLTVLRLYNGIDQEQRPAVRQLLKSMQPEQLQVAA